MKTLAWILAFNLINPCSTSEDVTVRSLTHCEPLLNFAKEILLFSISKPSPNSRESLLCGIWHTSEQPLRTHELSKMCWRFHLSEVIFLTGLPRYLRPGTNDWVEMLAKETPQHWLLFTAPEKVPASGQMGWGWACAFSKLCRTTTAVCHMQEADCSQGSKFLSATSC